jgi:beta-lactam-binding protein with PASTA domain
MLLGVAAIVLVLLGMGIAYFMTHKGNGTTTVVVSAPEPTTAPVNTSQIAVPSVRGESFAGARAKLEAAGFVVDRAPLTSSSAPGTVLRELPSPGTKAERGSVVTLGVAAAGPRTTTPASTAAPVTTATITSPTTTAGTVPGGTTSPPTRVTATMPVLTGQTEQQAVTSMSKTGLLPSLFFVPSADPLGTVEQQAKAAGTNLPYHTHVQINLSRGPGDKPDESVPNMIAQTIPQALATVHAQHLRLIYVRFGVTTRSQVGKIVQQSPLHGSRAPQNAQILVFLAVLARNSRP